MYSGYLGNIEHTETAKKWGFFVVGISISIAALACLQLELKWAIFSLSAVSLPFLASLSGNPKRFLLGVLIFAIPLNADVQFYLNPSPGGANSIALGATDIILFILLGYWVFEAATVKRTGMVHFFPEITVPTIMIILAGIISMLQATDLMKSIFDIIQHVKVLIFFIFLANHLRSREDIQFVVKIFFVGILIQMVFISLQYFKGTNIGLLGLGEPQTVLDFEMEASDVPRPGGTIGHCNHISRYVGLLLPVAIVLAYIKTTAKMKLLAIVTSLAGIQILILSLSRSAWAGLAVSIVAIAPLMISRRLLSPRLLRNILISIVLFVAVVFCFRGIIVGRLTSYDFGSGRTRLTTAKVALKIIQDHPFIGVGINNYGEVLEQYWDAEDSFTRKAAVHNTFLLYAAEIGVIGLIAYLLLLFGLFDQIRRATRAKDRFLTAVAVGFAGGFVAMLLMALSDKSYKENFPLMMIFWGMAAIIVAINQIDVSRKIVFPIFKRNLLGTGV